MLPELIDHALRYASRGWPVFPCREAGKLPLTPHGFKDATVDANQIRAWWKRWPSANIAVPTGAASGFVVVDVDGDRGRASLQALLDDHTDGQMPPTLASTTGHGCHLLFAAGDDPIRNTTGKLGEGIDTRGDGGYIIVPPSIHPTGVLYEWVDEAAQIAELPDWLRPADNRRSHIDEMPRPAIAKGAYTVSHDQSEQQRRASLYLATMDAAVQGAGGHDRLYAAATAMVHGFCLPQSVAREILLAEYNPRCSPPWDMGNARDARDFDRKINQAATQKHDRPRGWLLDEAMDNAGDVEHGARIAASLVASKSKVPPANTSDGFPGWLLQPPGYVGELTHWINSTAFKPQPMLALANALAFFGAVVGRKVADASDLRTNMYCLGVGESGCGKDHSRKQIKRLCAAAGLTDRLLGGEDVTSDVAIVQAAARNPSILFQFDEIGHMIASAHSRNAATYQRAIPVTLTKLFSSSNTVYLGKEYAGDAERQDIEQPNVCLYGTTVPSRLYEGITPSEIRDGFMGRMLVFQTQDDDPEPTDAEKAEPSTSLVEMAQAWYQRKIDPPAGTGSIDAAMRPRQVTVASTDDARRLFMDLRKRARNERARLVKAAPGLDSLWSRAEENARKVALTIAAGCDYSEPVIDEHIAGYACELVSELTMRLVEQIKNHVADTDVGRQINAIKAAVRAHGGSATKRQITRATQHKMRTKERNEAIETLVETGELVAESVRPGSSGGRPTVAYRLE